MDIRDDLQQSMNEEAAAAHAYRMRANYAYAVGDSISAELWNHIAGEEDGHFREFQERMNSLPVSPEVKEHAEKMEYMLGHRHPSQMSAGHMRISRRVPQTNEEWENLGYDIEAKRPADITMHDIRLQVAIATGVSEGDAGKAKRWLIQEAGKLGIG